jgi:hypothetical protein
MWKVKITIERRFNSYFFFAHPYAAWERGSNENMMVSSANISQRKLTPKWDIPNDHYVDFGLKIGQILSSLEIHQSGLHKAIVDS